MLSKIEIRFLMRSASKMEVFVELIYYVSMKLLCVELMISVGFRPSG